MLDLANRDRAYVIAEAATGHAAHSIHARFENARMLVTAAAATGADAVKFQIFAPAIRDDMFCWIEGDERRAGRWNDSALILDYWLSIKSLADSLGIDFLASVFQYRTVAWLKELGVKATKVASRASANFPYEDATGTLLISTGMPPYPRGKGIMLECEANYPSTSAWRDEFVGFSDHSGTPALAVDAISRGCRLVEVHFHIDPDHAGPDLPASLGLDDLKRVCEARDRFANIQRSAA